MRATLAPLTKRAAEVLSEHRPAAIELLAQAKAPLLDRPSKSTDARHPPSELNDRIGIWVNEGGAGDEVNR